MDLRYVLLGESGGSEVAFPFNCVDIGSLRFMVGVAFLRCLTGTAPHHIAASHKPDTPKYLLSKKNESTRLRTLPGSYSHRPTGEIHAC